MLAVLQLDDLRAISVVTGNIGKKKQIFRHVQMLQILHLYIAL